MKSILCVVGALMLALLMLCGCQVNKQLSAPPDMNAMINDKEIQFIQTEFTWDNKSEKNEKATSPFAGNNASKIFYYQIGSKVDIDFFDHSPETITITDTIIDDQGKPLYTDKENMTLPYELKKGKCTFEIPQNLATFLSSYYEENKKDFHRIALKATWGENMCEYVFFFKTDAMGLEKNIHIPDELKESWNMPFE